MNTPSISPGAKQQRGTALLRFKVLFGCLMRVIGWVVVFFAVCGVLSVAIYGGMAAFGHGPGPGRGPLMYWGDARFDCTTWQGVMLMLFFDLLLLGVGRGFIRFGKAAGVINQHVA